MKILNPQWTFKCLLVVNRTAISIALLVLAVVARADVPLPVIPNQYFNVTNYGAIGNGVADDTAAIQNTINAASAAGGGVVEIPAGTYLSGPLTLKNNINLQIDTNATLEMLPYGTYPGGSSPTDFISASKLHDIEISGGGTIDGQGAAWWSAYNSSKIARPKAMFAPTACTNILVRDITLQNPPNTHISFRSSNGSPCRNVTVSNITINTPDGTPNTDGMDMSVINAIVENSYISDGDDHIAMGDNHAFDHDIVVTNCLFGTGHGVSIGSYTTGGLSNLLVINCAWTGSENGIRDKSERGRGGLVQDLVYRNLSMTNVQWPILIYSHYEFGVGTLTGVTPYMASTDTVQTVTSTTPIWRNITFSNVTATTSSSRPAVMIWGLPEMLVSNVMLQDINISGAKSCAIYNVAGMTLANSQITLPSGQKTYLLYDADLTLTNSVPSANPVTFDGLTTNGVGNALSLFGVTGSLSNTNVIAGGPLTLGASTLNVGNNLLLFPASVFNYILGSTPATVAVAGNLTLGGTINLSAGAGFGAGTYTLLSYTGSLDRSLPTLGTVPSGYLYSFDTGTRGQVKLVVTSSAPPAPTNLVATPTNLAIRLKWNAAGSATSYNLKRGTAGGVYPTVFSGLTTTNYTDAAVTNAVRYYYVVSAVSSGNESTNSLEVSATPLPSNVSTNIRMQVNSGQLQLAWPQDHQGWYLQIQTNAQGSGISTNWVTVPNSQETNGFSLPIASTNGSVFLRLVYF